jgi:cytidyltransferase-like protein
MILSFNDLEKLQKEKITLVIGTFDILHIGHIFFLEEAKKAGNGNKLLVGIISDKMVKERKGVDRPVIHQEERAAIVDAIKSVDYVFVAPEEKSGEVSRKVIKIAKPEFSVISKSAFESREDPKDISGTNLVIINDEIINKSSTAIIRKIRGN